MGIPDHLTCLLRNLYVHKKQQLEPCMEQLSASGLRKENDKTACFQPVYLVYRHSTQVGWVTSWNQDCQEKYQQPQICRWYHSNVRKRRGTKEPLDEGKVEEWKIWLKTQCGKHTHTHKLRSWHLVPSLHGNWKGKGGSSDRFPLFEL